MNELRYDDNVVIVEGFSFITNRFNYLSQDILLLDKKIFFGKNGKPSCKFKACILTKSISDLKKLVVEFGKATRMMNAAVDLRLRNGKSAKLKIEKYGTLAHSMKAGGVIEIGFKNEVLCKVDELLV